MFSLVLFIWHEILLRPALRKDVTWSNFQAITRLFIYGDPMLTSGRETRTFQERMARRRRIMALPVNRDIHGELGHGNFWRSNRNITLNIPESGDRPRKF